MAVGGCFYLKIPDASGTSRNVVEIRKLSSRPKRVIAQFSGYFLGPRVRSIELSPFSFERFRRRIVCPRCGPRASCPQGRVPTVRWPLKDCRASREIRWRNAWEYLSQYQRSAPRWRRGKLCCVRRSSSSSSDASHCGLLILSRTDLQGHFVCKGSQFMQIHRALPEEFLVSSNTLRFLALITTTVSLSADGKYDSEIIKSPSSTLASCSAHGPSDFHNSTLSDKSTCASWIFRPPMQTWREYASKSYSRISRVRRPIVAGRTSNTKSSSKTVKNESSNGNFMENFLTHFTRVESSFVNPRLPHVGFGSVGQQSDFRIWICSSTEVPRLQVLRLLKE